MTLEVNTVAWERRGTGGPYFYRSVRRGRTVTRKYLGQGPAAEQAARQDEQRRAAREAQRQAVAEQQALMQPIQTLVKDLAAEANLLFEASMMGLGMHRVNYGRWRRKRG